MEIKEAALLCGIIKKPMTMKDEIIIERSEIKDLDTALRHLVNEGFLEKVETGREEIVDLMNRVLDSLSYDKGKRPDNNMLHSMLDQTPLLRYLPTEAGKQIVNDYEYLWTYMSTDMLKCDMDLNAFVTQYYEEKKKFDSEFYDHYVQLEETTK